MAVEYGDLYENGERVGPCAMNDQKGTLAVFFETGISEAQDGCVDSFNRIRDELNRLWTGGNVDRFVVVASADRQGDSSGYDNPQLSIDRYEYIERNVLPNGGIVPWAAGSAAAREFGEDPDMIDDPAFRAVYIYAVWRLARCQEDFVNNLGRYETELQEALGDEQYKDYEQDIQNALQGVRRAKQICDRPGKQLLASEDEELQKVYGLLLLVAEEVPMIATTNITVGLTSIYVISSAIDLYYSNLLRLRDGLGLSEWRDEKGNFNTTRLVSDSVAGVVLGTVGGIVTSKLVKKNQIKKGFEDLSCAVGGQTVAGYGDHFMVGLK